MRKIDELLGTQLQLRSRVGEGTQASLLLPLAEGPRAGMSDAAQSASPVAGRRVWILKGAENIHDRELKEALETWGADVASCPSMQALDVLRDSDGEWPDVAIVDVRCQSALDLAREARRRWPALVIVALYADALSAQGLRDEGFRVFEGLPTAQALAAMLD